MSKNQHRKQLKVILQEPLSRQRIMLASKVAAARAKDNPQPFTVQEFQDLINSIASPRDTFKREVENVMEAIATGKAPFEPNLRNPENQFVWGAALQFLSVNSDVMQKWPVPTPPENLAASPLWKQVRESRDAIEELLGHAHIIREALRSKDTKYVWGPPGTGVRYNRNKNVINIDFAQTLATGFEHARADVNREVGYSLLSVTYPKAMQALYQEMAPLMRRAQQAATKKAPKLSKQEYAKLRLLSAEWELRNMIYMAGEENAVNRYVSNLGQKMLQDFSVSLNNTAVTGRGLGLNAGLDPSQLDAKDSYKRYMNLANALMLHFYQSNNLFDNTDDSWQGMGVHPALVRTTETLKARKPSDPVDDGQGISHPDFKYLRDLGRRLEEAQPKTGLRMFGRDRFERDILRAALERNQIIEEIWEKFGEELIQDIMHEVQEQLEEQMKQQQDQDQDQDGDDQDQDQDGQDQDGDENDNDQDGQQGQKGQKGQKGKKGKKGQKGQPGDPSDDDDDGDDQDADGDDQDQDGQQQGKQKQKKQDGKDQKQKGQKQKGDQQDGDDADGQDGDGQDQDGQDQDGSQKGQKGDQQDGDQDGQGQDGDQDGQGQDQDGQDGQQGQGSEESKLGTDQDSSVPVEGMGDMPGVDGASETPEDARNENGKDGQGQDGDGQDADGQDGDDADGQDGDGQDADGQDGQDGQDGDGQGEGQTMDELQKALADAQAQQGQDGQQQGNKPGQQKKSNQAGHSDGKPLGDLAKQDWTQYEKRIAELQTQIQMIRKIFKKVQEKQLEEKKTISKDLDFLPENGELLERFNTESHKNLVIKQKIGNVEENDFKRFHKDETITTPTEIDVVLMIDGSGSMGMGSPSPLDSALQTAAILFEATSGQDMNINVWVVMWGHSDKNKIAVPIKPGANRAEVGRAMQAMRSGLGSGTDMAPAIEKVAETVAEQRGKAGTLSGFTHIINLSDGDISDPGPTVEMLKTMFQFTDKVTFDTALIGGSPNSSMARASRDGKGTKPQQEVGVVYETNPEKIPYAVTALLLDKIRKLGSFKAVTNAQKRREMRKAAHNMQNKRRR